MAEGEVEAHRVVGVDAHQFIDASEQIARIDGAIFDLFALGVGSANHLAAFEPAAGHER